jgi:fucose permease
MSQAGGLLKPPRAALVVPLSFVAFVSLGLPDGVLGTAWPSMRRTFGLPVSELGALLLSMMAGYLASSAAAGSLVARMGVGRLLLLSSLAVAASCAGYAVAPAWRLMLPLGLLSGAGAGAIDAGLNAYAAARMSPRLVAWLHASWGVGAMLGPLLITAVLESGLGWRWGYVAVGSALLALAICFSLTLDLWVTPASAAHAAPAPGNGVLRALRRPAVWIGIALFFAYSGVEATAGQWAYTLLSESRGLEPALAAFVVASYWASLTLGRVLAGLLASRVPTERLLRASTGAAVLAAALLWSNRGWASSLFGLVVLGLSLAPVFPLLISATPGRLGAGDADHAIGFQVSAACLGGAVVPAAAGLLARWRGIEAVAPYLFGIAVALFVLHEATRVGRSPLLRGER